MNVAVWNIIFAVCSGDSRWSRDSYTLQDMQNLYELYTLLGWEK